jgi:hypothetical protein
MHPGMEFRYAGNGQGGGSWNAVHRTPNRPAGFFCDGPGHRYLTAMDGAMNQARASTNARTTLGEFKAIYYGCERAFRAWLLDQPPQATLDFVRNFGEYDRRLVAMMMRYEARPGASGYTPIVFRADERASG